MTDHDRLTITLASDMAALVQYAVAAGDYASTDAVVRAALRDWDRERAALMETAATLEKAVGRGLADLAGGRVRSFETAHIVERGRGRSASRPTPCLTEAGFVEIRQTAAGEAVHL